MIELLVVDDHALVRRGLKQIFQETPDIRVKDEAANCQEAISKILNQKFDVLILDISLPGRSGLDLIKQIKELEPQLPILVLSIYPESQYAIRVLKAGASGYMTKDSQPEEVIEAIRKIARGEKHLTAQTVESLVNSLNHQTSTPPHTELSDREYQILLKIAGGQSMTEIARELALSIKTISTYRARILKKLQLKNTSEMICYAMRHGLV